MTKIDLSIFDDMKDAQPSTVTNSGNSDLFYMKTLYDNCARMGSANNSNVTVATVHPSLWFSEIFSKIESTIKLVTKNPAFEIYEIIDNKVVVTRHTCDTIFFTDEREMIEFFLSYDTYKKLAIFSIVKFLDLQTLKSSWNVRYKDLTTKSEMRDSKLNELI
jgi:hypothetical protein